MKIPDSYYTLKSNFLFCIAVPICLILFVVLYNPQFSFDTDVVSYRTSSAGLCMPIIAAIEMLCLLASRTLLHFAPTKIQLSRAEFIIWMIVEFIISCLFTGLFLSLYFHTNYFDLLPRIILIGFCLNIIPYSYYLFIMAMLDRDTRINQANLHIAQLRKNTPRPENNMIRFDDDKGNTKLVVSSERVISIESAGNYVNILYDDSGKLIRLSLRNTLKGIEDLCNANGLIRCHRSYFVNLSKIKVIRKTPDGVFAEMDREGLGHIPVSKTYASDLLRLFSEN